MSERQRRRRGIPIRERRWQTETGRIGTEIMRTLESAEASAGQLLSAIPASTSGVYAVLESLVEAGQVRRPRRGHYALRGGSR